MLKNQSYKVADRKVQTLRWLNEYFTQCAKVTKKYVIFQEICSCGETYFGKKLFIHFNLKFRYSKIYSILLQAYVIRKVNWTHMSCSCCETGRSTLHFYCACSLWRHSGKIFFFFWKKQTLQFKVDYFWSVAKIGKK